MAQDTAAPDIVIWLEVSNVRFDKDNGVQVQLKGDRADREPRWWPVAPEVFGAPRDPKASPDPRDTFREIANGLDKRRVVLAALGWAEEGRLECQLIRIQSADSTTR